MIQLTYEQKNSIGLQYILDRLNPSSPYGQERVRRMTPYTVEEKDLLMEELSNLEKLMNKKEDLKHQSFASYIYADEGCTANDKKGTGNVSE